MRRSVRVPASSAGLASAPSRTGEPNVVVLMGPTNAGKSTALKALHTSGARIRHFAVRVYFSEQTLRGTPIGQEAYALSLRRRWLPDVFVGQAFANWLEEQLGTGPDVVVLEGFPRNSAQARIADEVLEDRHLDLGGLILVDAPDEVLLARATRRTVCVICDSVVVDGVPVEGQACPACGGPVVRRRDDEGAVARDRIRSYRASDAEIRTYYSDRGAHLYPIDGTASREEVAAAVRAAVLGPRR